MAAYHIVFQTCTFNCCGLGKKNLNLFGFLSVKEVEKKLMIVISDCTVLVKLTSLLQIQVLKPFIKKNP